VQMRVSIRDQMAQQGRSRLRDRRAHRILVGSLGSDCFPGNRFLYQAATPTTPQSLRHELRSDIAPDIGRVPEGHPLVEREHQSIAMAIQCLVRTGATVSPNPACGSRALAIHTCPIARSCLDCRRWSTGAKSFQLNLSIPYRRSTVPVQWERGVGEFVGIGAVEMALEELDGRCIAYRHR
jgi:hypothetical protein